MSKLAIFVEGLAEQVFIEKLVKEIAGAHNVRFELRKASGAVSDRRRFRLLQAVPDDVGQEHYVLIVDCGNDELVNSRIREEYETLEREAYNLIIGLRDIYPLTRAEIPYIRRRQYFRIKTAPIPVVFVMAIMEIEAWFLAEHTHFERLHARLSSQIISGWLGFDPSVEDMEQRDRPALDMMVIYLLAGEEYKKKLASIRRTVNLLDYNEICLSMTARYAEIELLTSRITQCLFPN
jgi:hypothetical protein